VPIDDQYTSQDTLLGTNNSPTTGDVQPDLAPAPAAALVEVAAVVAPVVPASPPRDGGTYSFNPATGAYTRIA
jgi:hypothetical protein